MSPSLREYSQFDDFDYLSASTGERIDQPACSHLLSRGVAACYPYKNFTAHHPDGTYQSVAIPELLSGTIYDLGDWVFVGVNQQLGHPNDEPIEFYFVNWDSFEVASVELCSEWQPAEYEGSYMPDYKNPEIVSLANAIAYNPGNGDSWAILSPDGVVWEGELTKTEILPQRGPGAGSAQ